MPHHTTPAPLPSYSLCPQEDVNVDEAFATIARNALKNETEEELYIPGGAPGSNVLLSRCRFSFAFPPFCG